jgi:hypothetical protein
MVESEQIEAIRSNLEDRRLPIHHFYHAWCLDAEVAGKTIKVGTQATVYSHLPDLVACCGREAS